MWWRLKCQFVFVFNECDCEWLRVLLVGRFGCRIFWALQKMHSEYPFPLYPFGSFYGVFLLLTSRAWKLLIRDYRIFTRLLLHICTCSLSGSQIHQVPANCRCLVSIYCSALHSEFWLHFQLTNTFFWSTTAIAYILIIIHIMYASKGYFKGGGMGSTGNR
jgi:hypothetical protein